METAHTAQRTTVALLAAGVSLFLAAAAQADPITFSGTPASSVVSQLSHQYGVSIVFKSDVNFTQPVTFSVADITAPGGRLQAVRRLANALGMDIHKVYVVSKIDPGTTVPSVKIDNNGPIEFSATKVPAQEAIREIAAADGATAKISSVIKGSVVFPHRLTTASKAAAIVAKQTKTVWKAYYGFTQRPGLPMRYAATPPAAPPVGALPTPAAPPDNVPATPLPNAPTVATVPNTDQSILPTVPPMPYGNYGYGYNPYVSGGFGYPAPNGGVAYPGNVYTVGGGVQQVVPGVNAPGFFPPGATVTTISPTNVTVLPDAPFQGNYGGPVYSNGY
ncbi:MAG: hypothetical protein M3Y13_03575 [Armatimonadota bacterium]|nr:hypothetical protein [Armatimonadota bacterium]